MPAPVVGRSHPTPPRETPHAPPSADGRCRRGRRDRLPGRLAARVLPRTSWTRSACPTPVPRIRSRSCTPPRPTQPDRRDRHGVSRQVTVAVTAPVNPAFNAASGTIGGGTFSLGHRRPDEGQHGRHIHPDRGGRQLDGGDRPHADVRRPEPRETSSNAPSPVVATDIPVTINLDTSTGTKTLTTAISTLTRRSTSRRSPDPGDARAGEQSSPSF